MNANAMSLMNCGVSGQTISTSGGNTISWSYTPGTSSPTLWNYWTDCYYPQVILQSYPVYFQEKSMDKGKQAFELLKALMDKNLVKVDKVKDFIEAMDTILKTL